MNPGAPEDAHIGVVLQQVQHSFGSIKVIAYQASLISPSTAVNTSADSLSRHVNIGCVRTAR